MQHSRIIQSAIGAALALLLGVGCGLFNEGTGAVTGTIQGGNFVVKSSLFSVGANPAEDGNSTAGGNTVTLSLYNQGNVCSNAANNSDTARADALSFIITPAAGQALQPGSYAVTYVNPNSIVGNSVPTISGDANSTSNPNSVAPPATNNGVVVQALYSQSDESCNKTLAAGAINGTLTLLQVDTGKSIDGSFGVTFGNNTTLTGAFSAQSCGPLANSYTLCE